MEFVFHVKSQVHCKQNVSKESTRPTKIGEDIFLSLKSLIENFDVNFDLTIKS